MFHRVKPESQPEAPANREPVGDISEKAQQEKLQDRSFEARPFQKAAAEQSEKKQVQPQPQTSPFKQEKDTKTMNEKSFESQDEQSAPAAAPRSLEIPAGAYQRPGQAPARPPVGGYPGAYPGSASYALHAPRQEAATASQRTLTIGSGITMSGEIESCDYLLVEGTVEAALKGASVLEIAESGIFYGTVEINEATVAGRFEGDIKVNGRLTIRSTGTITGSIAYKELEVESGAMIDGRLTPVSSSSTQAKAPAKGKQQNASAKMKSARDEQLEAANSDGELFASSAAAE